MTEVNRDQQIALGKLLREIRIFLDLTQFEVAQRFGVTEEEISLFENDLPVRLHAKIRILKQLYSQKRMAKGRYQQNKLRNY